MSLRETQAPGCRDPRESRLPAGLCAQPVGLAGRLYFVYLELINLPNEGREGFGANTPEAHFMNKHVGGQQAMV